MQKHKLPIRQLCLSFTAPIGNTAGPGGPMGRKPLRSVLAIGRFGNNALGETIRSAEVHYASCHRVISVPCHRGFCNVAFFGRAGLPIPEVRGFL